MKGGIGLFLVIFLASGVFFFLRLNWKKVFHNEFHASTSPLPAWSVSHHTLIPLQMKCHGIFTCTVTEPKSARRIRCLCLLYFFLSNLTQIISRVIKRKLVSILGLKFTAQMLCDTHSICHQKPSDFLNRPRKKAH